MSLAATRPRSRRQVTSVVTPNQRRPPLDEGPRGKVRSSTPRCGSWNCNRIWRSSLRNSLVTPATFRSSDCTCREYPARRSSPYYFLTSRADGMGFADPAFAFAKSGRGPFRCQVRAGTIHMKNITLAIIATLAGCASEKIYHTQTSNPTSEKVYHTQTSSPTGVAVLVGRSARIEGRE